MLKNSSRFLSAIGASALAVLSVAAPVEAKGVNDWTCVDYLKLPSGQKSSAVYFFTGMNLADKKDSLDLAAKHFGVSPSQVTQYCQKHRTEPLWPAIINHFNLP